MAAFIPAIWREPKGSSAIGKISVRKSQLGDGGRPEPPADDLDPEELSKLSRYAMAAYLSHRLKWEMSESQRQCGLRRHAPTVSAFEFVKAGDGRLAFEGVARCKSPLCPLCAPKWQRTRAAEIKQAIDYHEEKHGPGCVKFLTLTPRHNRGMALGLLQRIETKAFGDFYSGRQGMAFARQISGFVHPVEDASENACAGGAFDFVTAPPASRRWRRRCSSGPACTGSGEWSEPIDHSAVPFTHPQSVRAHDGTWALVHGWHPHLHALIFLAAPGDDEELEELFFGRWCKKLIGSLRSFKNFARRVLAGETCAVYKRHARRAARFASAAATPHCCAFEPFRGLTSVLQVQRGDELVELVQCTPMPDESVDELRGDSLVTQTVSTTACRAGAAGEASATIVSPVENTRRNRERIRRLAGDVDQCRAGEPRRHPEPHERIAQAYEWQSIVGVEQCWACHEGRECSHTRERAEKLFGVRMVRRHVPLRESMIVINRALKKFREKELLPRRSYGCKLETARDPAKLDEYLTKLGAMGFELAWSSGKRGSGELGTVKGDGQRHYGKWEVAIVSTLHGDPLREHCRRDWGELFRATFGTQQITFSDRAALGLGPDPYADDAEPDEQGEGETKIYRGDFEPDVWDEQVKTLHHVWLIEVERAYRSGRLDELGIEPPSEAFERAQGPPPSDAVPECTGPPTRRQREHETSEAFRRALDPAEAAKRVEARRTADERNGEALPDDSDFAKRKALRAFLAEMRAQHEAEHPTCQRSCCARRWN